MSKGVVIKKSRDLNENLFWSLYDQGVVEWIDKNYTTENEDYSYCVARENMKLIYDAVKYGIPFFIDLKRKTGDANINCIFDIKNDVPDPDIGWFDLFREYLKREVIQCSRKELPQYIAKNYFFKSKEKGFSCKGVRDFVSKLPTSNYGQWCYPLEDRGISNEDFLSNPIAHPEAVVDMIKIYQDFLVSPLRDFDFNKEIRVIFCGSEVASIASKHDYKNELPKGIEEYAEIFARKYGEKVPYLIWSVDFHPIKDGFDIIEGHLHCDLLGKFYGNQDFRKLFEITNRILSYEK